jgi:hypothetical protein
VQTSIGYVGARSCLTIFKIGVSLSPNAGFAYLHIRLLTLNRHIKLRRKCARAFDEDGRMYGRTVK